MDAVSYSHSAKQAQRIKRFIENPDSNSGILTQPKVIEAGETVTIKSGRQAILANTVIEGDLSGVFNNILLIIELKEPKGQEAFDFLKEKYAANKPVLESILQHETMFKNAVSGD